MRYLLRNLKISDSQSAYDGQNVNILIDKGIILEIGLGIISEGKEIDFGGSICSPGLVDLSALIGDPGLEFKEDAASASVAAMKGGFTTICTLPNTHPIVQSKSEVKYLLEKQLPISILPIGALSEETKGENLTEMLDLNDAGAIAFSDGLNPIWNSELLLKALQYVSKFNGLVIQRPKDIYLSSHSQMHEGVVSTSLGMKGSPAMAEEIVIKRDLDILRYAGGRLHFTQLSCAGAVQLIKEAKLEGLNVSCDVNFHHLLFTDVSLDSYDTNFKLDPPLRSETDRSALIQGLKDGTIDAICTGHNPQDTESKELEFDLSEFGAIGLQVATAALNSHATDLDLNLVFEKLSLGPRKIHNLRPQTIAKGEMVDLNIFNPDVKWKFDNISNMSKSKNSPFFNTELRGKCVAVFSKGQLHQF